MYQNRPAEFFEAVGSHHRAHQAERVLVSHLDEVGFFFEQDLADERIRHHLLPWHHYPITPIKDWRIFCGYVVDPSKIVDVLNSLSFTGNDQSNEPLMPLGGSKEIVVRRAYTARIFMVVVC